MIAKIEKGKYAATVSINEYSKLPKSLQENLELNSDSFHVWEDTDFAVFTFEIDMIFDHLIEMVSNFTEIIVITQDNQAHWI